MIRVKKDEHSGKLVSQAIMRGDNLVTLRPKNLMAEAYAQRDRGHI